MRFSSFNVGLVIAFFLMGCQPPKTAVTSSVCKGVSAGELVITELMVDPAGTDTGKEYIEIFNTTDEDIDLKNLTLYTQKIDGTSEKIHSMKSQVLSAKSYLALGDTRTNLETSEIGYSYGTSLGALSNNEGVVGIRCGQTIVDEARYTDSTPAKSSQFTGTLAPNSTLNDDEANWCSASTEYAAGSFGSPGKTNSYCGVGGECLAATGVSRAALAPQEGQLIVTEFLANPKGVDTEKEWIEVHALADVDLNGITLKVGNTSTVFSSTDCLYIPSGGYAVLAKSNNPDLNSGLTGVLATFAGSLTNTSGALSLESGPTIIDSVSYGSTTEGVASQLSSDKTDAITNDDPTSFCTAIGGYGDGTNKGTPGLSNIVCPVVLPADQCLDEMGAARPIVKPVTGDLIITEFHADPTGTDTGKEWVEVYVQQTVDLNGLELANEGTGKVTFNASTCLKAEGNSYLVFAGSADSAQNGGLPDPIAGTFGFALANTGTRGILLRYDTEVIDSISYGTSTDGGKSLMPAQGVSIQLDPSLTSWCKTPADAGTYGSGEVGTPGGVNVSCAP